MPGIQRPFTGGVAPHVARGQYVQQCNLTYMIRMVKRQAMGCARSPVVTGQEKALMSERGHHVHLISSHSAKRVIDVLRAAVLGPDTVAVAPEICHDDVIPAGQGARDLVPADVRLRVAMEQQKRLPRAAMPEE